MIVSDRLASWSNEEFTALMRILPVDGGHFYGHAYAGNSYPWLGHLWEGCERLGEEAAKRVVRAELVPWALGYGDPVRERVEARQRGARTGE